MSLSLSIRSYHWGSLSRNSSYRIFLQLIIVVVDPLLRPSSSKVYKNDVILKITLLLKMMLFNQVISSSIV